MANHPQYSLTLDRFADSVTTRAAQHGLSSRLHSRTAAPSIGYEDESVASDPRVDRLTTSAAYQLTGRVTRQHRYPLPDRPPTRHHDHPDEPIEVRRGEPERTTRCPYPPAPTDSARVRVSSTRASRPRRTPGPTATGSTSEGTPGRRRAPRFHKVAHGTPYSTAANGTTRPGGRRSFNSRRKPS